MKGKKVFFYSLGIFTVVIFAIFSFGLYLDKQLPVSSIPSIIIGSAFLAIFPSLFIEVGFLIYSKTSKTSKELIEEKKIIDS